jgi:hypothetical protein
MAIQKNEEMGIAVSSNVPARRLCAVFFYLVDLVKLC